MAIELGDRVRDKMTGLAGIAIGVTNWIYGCRRIVVQPEEAKDGKPAETFCVDEPQLSVVKKGVITPIYPVVSEPKQDAPKRTHGPRSDPPRY